jgi:hypothetical protein
MRLLAVDCYIIIIFLSANFFLSAKERDTLKKTNPMTISDGCLVVCLGKNNIIKKISHNSSADDDEVTL